MLVKINFESMENESDGILMKVIVMFTWMNWAKKLKYFPKSFQVSLVVVIINFIWLKLYAFAWDRTIHELQQCYIQMFTCLIKAINNTYKKTIQTIESQWLILLLLLIFKFHYIFLFQVHFIGNKCTRF